MTDSRTDRLAALAYWCLYPVVFALAGALMFAAYTGVRLP